MKAYRVARQTPMGTVVFVGERSITGDVKKAATYDHEFNASQVAGRLNRRLRRRSENASPWLPVGAVHA